MLCILLIYQKCPVMSLVLIAWKSFIHCDANMPLSRLQSLFVKLRNSPTHTGELSLCLNRSLYGGRVADERKDVVDFMSEIAETNQREEQLWSQQAWKKWGGRTEEKSIHCCKICMKVLWEPAKYVHAHCKECSLLCRTREVSASRLPFIEKHKAEG